MVKVLTCSLNMLDLLNHTTKIQICLELYYDGVSSFTFFRTQTRLYIVITYMYSDGQVKTIAVWAQDCTLGLDKSTPGIWPRTIDSCGKTGSCHYSCHGQLHSNYMLLSNYIAKHLDMSSSCK